MKRVRPTVYSRTTGLPSNGTTYISAPFKAVPLQYTWMRRIGHPPSVGGTLPRNTSFIINGRGGDGWAAHRSLKAVAELFLPHQEKKQDVPSLWCGTWVIFLSACRLTFNSTLTLASVFVFPHQSGLHEVLSSCSSPRSLVQLKSPEQRDGAIHL